MARQRADMELDCPNLGPIQPSHRFRRSRFSKMAPSNAPGAHALEFARRTNGDPAYYNPILATQTLAQAIKFSTPQDTGYNIRWNCRNLISRLMCEVYTM